MPFHRLETRYHALKERKGPGRIRSSNGSARKNRVEAGEKDRKGESRIRIDPAPLPEG